MGSVIVTGANGFIGKATTLELAARGHNVVAVFRSKLPEIEQSSIRQVVADLTDRPGWEVLRQYSPEAVIHIAASVPVSFDSGSSAGDAERNRKMDRQAVHFCADSRSRLIYASSTSVFRLDSDCRDNAYALEKKEAEELISLSQIREKSCSLRINAPYGPGQRMRTVIKLFIELALKNQTLYYHGTGARSQDFVYIDDVARAFVSAYEKTASGVFTVASGTSISMKELAQLVVQVTPGCKSEVKPSGTPDPEELYRAAFDISETRKKLQWTPAVALTEGIHALMQSLEVG